MIDNSCGSLVLNLMIGIEISIWYCDCIPSSSWRVKWDNDHSVRWLRSRDRTWKTHREKTREGEGSREEGEIGISRNRCSVVSKVATHFTQNWIGMFWPFFGVLQVMWNLSVSKAAPSVNNPTYATFCLNRISFGPGSATSSRSGRLMTSYASYDRESIGHPTGPEVLNPGAREPGNTRCGRDRVTGFILPSDSHLIDPRHILISAANSSSY